MKTLTNRARRGAASFTLITAAIAMAGTSAASDCSMKKVSTDYKQTAQVTTTAHTSVMSSPIVYAGYKKKNKGTIVDAAIATESLSTLVAAVKAAELVDALAGPGPLTVFAPTNMAFDALPDGTVATLLKPENKEQLQTILTAHVVSGNLSAADIVGLAKQNGGSVDVTTLSGDTLTAVLKGDTLYVRDEQGGLASVKKADIMKSNGVVHIVDRVLLPS